MVNVDLAERENLYKLIQGNDMHWTALLSLFTAMGDSIEESLTQFGELFTVFLCASKISNANNVDT